ncbi:MAG: serine protease [Azospirillaceae bacterium]
MRYLGHGSWLSAVALAAAAFGAQPVPAAAQDFCEDDSRVMGGCTVSIQDFPWQVSLGFPGNSRYDGHLCGGSVIEDTWILTAAHCLDYGSSVARPRDIIVYAGSSSLDGGGRVVDVERIVLHPDYGGVGRNDIALLELMSPIGIAPVRLAAPGDPVERPGAQSVVTGWGLTPPSGVALGPGNLTVAERASSNPPRGWAASRVLLGAAVPVVDTALCGAPGDNSIVCAGFEEARADACRGDSGGPLHGIDEQGYIQIGLVSGGNYCHHEGDHYGIYTRVSAYRDWIEAEMSGATPPPPPVPDKPTSGGPNVDLPPTFGSMDLVTGFLPDPHAVPLQAGGDLDATVLGGNCVGFVAEAPDFQLTYEAGQQYPLHIYVEGTADTTLAVSAPDGRWYCDDDSGQELSPALTWQVPSSGRFDIYVGTYDSPERAGFPEVTLNISEVFTGR